ncbi:hypothetical protein F2P81_016476 [Scophthalmus maximus]|uniref:MBD domain-containing protein n=1 Tax=Scophthalmus maximus TaxID=52904 RepID=A0A6A4SLA3_SCOMX|nr:hypothetical protein F2P81_016476 [Scophthalmus maximus]
MMERKRTDCAALPPGWKKEEVIRKSGLSAGKSDVYYYSPTGKKFRSKPQLSRYLGNAVDLGCFDFRTGKMMPGKLQKSKARLRHDQLMLAKGGKPDLNTALPIRQTASIFKQPVTKVTSHPGNKQHDLYDLMNSVSAGVGPDSGDDSLLSAIASALHMSSSPITGQTSVAAEKNPAVWLNTSQPLCRAFTVTDEHIRRRTKNQTDKHRLEQNASSVSGRPSRPSSRRIKPFFPDDVTLDSLIFLERRPGRLQQQ